MVLGPGVQRNPALEAAGRLFDGLLFLGLHEVDDRRVGVHDDRIAGQLAAITADLPENLVGDGGARLNLSRAVAVEARLVHHAAEALPRSLPRHLDQAELADSIQRRLGLVLREALL